MAIAALRPKDDLFEVVCAGLAEEIRGEVAAFPGRR
jgi:hypothetical protein